MIFEAVGSGVLAASLEVRLQEAEKTNQIIAIRKLKWNPTEEALMVQYTYTSTQPHQLRARECMRFGELLDLK